MMSLIALSVYQYSFQLIMSFYWKIHIYTCKSQISLSLSLSNPDYSSGGLICKIGINALLSTDNYGQYWAVH